MNHHHIASWYPLYICAVAIALLLLPQIASAASPTLAFQLQINSNQTGAPPALALDIGTPRQRLLVTLETASELTWLPCTGHSADSSFKNWRSQTFARVPCGNYDYCFNSYAVAAPHPYSPAVCNSHPHLPCSFVASTSPLPFASDIFNYAASIGPRSSPASLIRGFIAIDTFSLLPPLASASAAAPLLRRLAFGCAETTFRSPGPLPSSGAIGFSPGPYSFASQILRNDALVEQQRFAYCFLNPPSGSVAAGALLLGGYELPQESLLPQGRRSLSYTRFQYARTTSAATRYYAAVAEIVVEGGDAAEPYVIDPSVDAAVEPDRPLHLATFDSSAEVTTLPSRIYESLVQEIWRRTLGLEPLWRSEGAERRVLCYRANSTEVAATMPVVRVRFARWCGEGGEGRSGGCGGGGNDGMAELKLGADNLVEEGGESGVCVSLRGDSEEHSLGNITVMGHKLQRNHWVEFDLRRGLIGVATADCSLAVF